MTWFTILAVIFSIGFVIFGRYSGWEFSGLDSTDESYLDISDSTDLFD